MTPPKTVIPEKYKVEEEAPVKQADAPQTFVIKTEMDAYVNERLQTQPKELSDIKVDEVIDVRPSHMLMLPKEIEDAFKKRDLAPRWINKKKQAIDWALDQRGWMLVNRTYFPEVKRHHFTANGTIERGDVILGFMPAKRAEKLRKRPGEISSERLKDLPINAWSKDENPDAKIGYYKPALTSEKDGEQMIQGIQPDKPNPNEE